MTEIVSEKAECIVRKEEYVNNTHFGLVDLVLLYSMLNNYTASSFRAAEHPERRASRTSRICAAVNGVVT